MSSLNTQTHILMARGSRNSASLSSPIETHVHAAASPSSYQQQRHSPNAPNTADSSGNSCGGGDLDSSDDMDSDDESIQVEETFTKRNTKMPGTVKIQVGSTTFWAHKEILYFACPFFASALSGNWAETNASTSGKRQSISSVITISPAGDDSINGLSIDQTVHDLDSSSASEDDEFDHVKANTLDSNEEAKKHARNESLKQLEKPREEKPFAFITLREEKAHIFHDFLKFVYPHLECTVAWNNVEGLFNLAQKLCVDSLHQACLSFLITHAAGKPIRALRIAELFSQEDLYREASRFVLENPGGWAETDLASLSPETLLKLEKRRNWFLERVLKLGLTNIAKVYQCHPACPDSTACGRILDERWRSGYLAVFRFGPCQPSMVYRYLRTMEAVSPPLQLGQLACQTAAKAFALNLFDRMFSLGIADTAPPINPLAKGNLSASAAAGPRRQFLYCTLRPDPVTKGRSSKEGA